MHTTTNLHIGEGLPPIDATASPTTICVRVGYDLSIYGTRQQLIDLAKGIQEAVFAVAPPEPVPAHSLGAKVQWTTDGAVPTCAPMADHPRYAGTDRLILIGDIAHDGRDQRTGTINTIWDDNRITLRYSDSFARVPVEWLCIGLAPEPIELTEIEAERRS